jgi:hypothetical protein
MKVLYSSSACARRAAGSASGLEEKPPFAPSGTMTTFLTCWVRDEAEHLRAEVGAVRPADAAAGDLAEAQVHALDIALCT